MVGADEVVEVVAAGFAPNEPKGPGVVDGAVAAGVEVVGAVVFWPPRPPRPLNNPELDDAEVVGVLKRPDEVVAGPGVVEGAKLDADVDGAVVEACVLGVLPGGLKLIGAFVGCVSGVVLLGVGGFSPLKMLPVVFDAALPPSAPLLNRPEVCAGFEVRNKPEA